MLFSMINSASVEKPINGLSNTCAYSSIISKKMPLHCTSISIIWTRCNAKSFITHARKKPPYTNIVYGGFSVSG